MPLEAKLVWTYTSDEYQLDLLQEDENLLVIRARGVVDAQGTLDLLAFLRQWVADTGTRPKVLTDNTQQKKVSTEGRRALKAWTEEALPILRLATFGDNLLVRAVWNLYATVAKFPVRLFDNEQDAREWLNTGE